MIKFAKVKRPTYQIYDYRVCDVFVDDQRVGSIWKWEIGYQYLANEDTASSTWHKPVGSLETAMNDLIYLPLILNQIK